MFAYTKIMQGIQAVSAAVTDAYFNLVTLLLPGNGTNGAQNNTFLDSSTNNFTITRNGNTTQGTFTPFSQTGWSNYFDGTDDYLSIADNAVLRPGTSNFTLEAWIWRGASGAAHTIYAKGGTSTGIVFQVTSTNVLRFTHTTTNIDSTGTISANAWTHVAVVREGTGTNQTKLYINGTQDGQGTVSTDFTQTEEVRIGTNRGATDDFNGYISNLRFVKGTALYTGTFTPSTTPLTTTSQGATATEVELLTCQSNRFIDNSSNAFAITANGTPSVQAFSPFAPTAAYSAATNGGSGYFDGSGDYLNFTGNSNTSIGSNDWTVEAWIYCTSFSQQYQQILRGQSSNMILLMLETTAKRVQCEIGGGSSAYSPATLQLNTWTHCAAVRSGSNVTVYLNGVGGTAVSMNPTTTTTEAFRIGTDTDLSRWFNGYICGLRMVKGTAVYTADFTPPTAPPTSITNTQLLLNFTNAGITDATAKNDLETVGNASISTAQSKFGGGSMYFDGTGDYLQSSDTNLCVLGSSDWTIEFWLNLTANNATAGLVVKETSAANGYNVYLSSSGKLSVALSSNGTTYDININGTTTLNTGTWYYCAVVRSGSGTNNIKVYVNGSQDAQATFASSINNAGFLRIGSRDGSSQYFNGYIDDLRITKGYARYTANFTPTTTTFPLQ